MFQYLRPLLDLPELSRINAYGQTLSDAQYMLKEYNNLFTDPDTGGYNKDNGYYDLLIFNNLPNDAKFCEFCGNEHKDEHCLFRFEAGSTLKEVL